MGKIGVLGILMVCAAAVISIWTMTGPRAAYWRAIFTPTVVHRLPEQPRLLTSNRPDRGTNFGFEGTAEAFIASDHSQAILQFEETAASRAEVLEEIERKREVVRSVLEGEGFENVVISDGGLSVSEVPNPAYRSDKTVAPVIYRGELRVAATIPENVDILHVFAQEELAALGDIEGSYFWVADLDAALYDAEDRALKNAMRRAERSLPGHTIDVQKIQFTNTLKSRAEKYKHRNLRVIVTARVDVLARKIPEPDIESGAASPSK